MKAVILAFLLQLDAIGAADPTLYNFGVLAAIHQPVHAALVEGRSDVVVPDHFGMQTRGADLRVQLAVKNFIDKARATPEFASAPGTDARIDLLFGETGDTPEGRGYDDYFAFGAMR